MRATGYCLLVWLVVTPVAMGSEYTEVILADNPVGYWKLDETSGNVARDSSANGIDGFYLGSPLRGIPGVSGTAVHFKREPSIADDADGVIIGPNPKIWFHRQGISMEAWIVLDDPDQGSARTLLSTRNTSFGITTASWEWYQADGHLVLWFPDSQGKSTDRGGITIDPVILDDARIRYVVAIFDDERRTSFFVNGKPIPTFQYGDSPNRPTETPLRIGYRGGIPVGLLAREERVNGWGGDIDEVGFYDYPLNSVQILNHCWHGARNLRSFSCYPDTNGDGHIDMIDLTVLLANWTGAAASQLDKTWVHGDSNGDGRVDSLDLTNLLANWTGAMAEAHHPVSVPEAGSSILLIIWLSWLLRLYQARSGPPLRLGPGTDPYFWR